MASSAETAVHLLGLLSFIGVGTCVSFHKLFLGGGLQRLEWHEAEEGRGPAGMRMGARPCWNEDLREGPAGKHRLLVLVIASRTPGEITSSGAPRFRFLLLLWLLCSLQGS